MKDFLLDVVKNTAPLGDVVIAIDSTDDNIEITGNSGDSQIFMIADTAGRNIDQLSGKSFMFGLSKIGMLRNLLQHYKDKKSAISLKTEKRKDLTVPTELVFESPEKSVSRYRLTHETQIPDQYERVERNYDVTIPKPPKTLISEFNDLFLIYKEVEDHFQLKIIDDDLYFVIGDEHESSHNAMFKFSEDIGEDVDIKTGNKWNTKLFIDVLKLSDGAQCSVSFSTDLIQINIDSGICVYTFYMPGTF